MAVAACLLPLPVKSWYSNHFNFSDIITSWMATYVVIPNPLNHHSANAIATGALLPLALLLPVTAS